MKIRNKIFTTLIAVIFLLSFSLISCSGQVNASSITSSSQAAAITKTSTTSIQTATTTTNVENITTKSQATTATTAQTTTTNEEKISNLASSSSKLIVHYIDVGQGDSELIQIPGNINILIDGGTKSSSKKVVSYIKSLGIDTLDIVISTHPHED